MTNNANKRRIWLSATAVILAVALLLSCALAAFLYTRTDNTGTGTVAEGDGADEVYGLSNRGYGTSIYNGATPAIPSGATGYAIGSETALSNFLSTAVANSGTTYYGYLTTNISLSSSIKPSTDRKLPANATLDGNGYTITSYHQERNAWDYNNTWNAIGSEDNYIEWWGFSSAGGSGTAVSIYSGVSAYGLSNIISVNYGTIKNLNIGYERNSNNSDIQAIYISPNWDGNVSMGGVAGINFGTIYNCSVDFNIEYGFIGSQYFSNGTSSRDRGVISYQQLVAVGGIAGYNGVNPSNTSQTGQIYGCKVVTREAFGSFRSKVSTYDSARATTYEIPNDPVVSSVVAGVAAINNGGVISGVDYSATGGSLYNNVWHSSKSYTGMITGITNLQSTVQGMTLNGSTWNFSPSVVTNLTLSVANISIVAEAFDATFGRERYGRLTGDTYTGTGNYCGLVGGQVSNGADISTVTVYGGNLDTIKNVNFRQWAATELNSTVGVTDVNMPKFGYGTNNTNDYINEITSISTRFEGQRLDSNGTDLTSVGATVSYVWDAEQQTDGSWISGLRQNIDFTNISGINGSTYYIYGTQSYVNGNASYSNGKAIYDSSNVTYGGLAVISSSATSSSIEYNYSILFENFTDTNALNAFAGGGSDSSFAYAYANAVKLTRENTLSSPSLTGDKVMKNWKTLDGNGQTLILNGTATNVSGSSVQVSVGGQNVVGISDLISVNYGTIKNLNVYYGTSSRTDTGSIISTNSFAYGRVAGINFGTISNVEVNNGMTVGDGSPTNIWTNSSFGAVGLAVGVNAGTIDTLHTIVWRNLSATASTFAAAGGAVGMNDGGTLRNVIVDGVASASVTATASDSYVGGVLGAGSNYGSWTSGQVTVSAPSGATSSPFEDWTFVGKQILNTAGSNVGMLAGRAAANASLASNGNQAIREMVVMMPQTDAAVGWFTSQKGKMSLLGTCSGTAASSGYIETDLVVGYYAYIDDASAAYISKIYTDYNMAKADSGITMLFATPVYSGSSAVRSVSSISVQTENMTATAAAKISFNANLSATTQSAVIPAQVATTDSVFVANDGNYAPAVKLYYDYDVNLSQSASDADASMSKTSLEAFVSGDASSASGVGTHKIIAAGANGATLTSDMTLSVTIVADFSKTRGLDGGGHTVTYVPGALGGVSYDKDGRTLTAIGVLASVNRTSVNNVNVAIGNSVTANVGTAYAFGGIVGVNLGTVAGTVSYGSYTLSLSGNNAYSYFGGAVGINAGTADGIRISFGGGTLYANNGSGTRTVLGGAIGLQESAALTDVQVTGNGAKLTVDGAGLVGGVVGLANLGDGATVAGITAAKTSLVNVANAVYGMTLNSTGGYKGLISGALSEGAVTGTLSGIAAHYPDGTAAYEVPWRTTTSNAISMYGFGSSSAMEGILFKITDYSKDGAAVSLADRALSVNGANKSFTFDTSQLTSLSSISFDVNYRYYDGAGFVTDESYSGSPSQSGNSYTVAVNGAYANSAVYVPVLDVLIDYSVVINNGENQQLVDFMRGEGTGSYAGAHSATLANGAAFALDAGTASQRAESLADKILSGTGNNVTVSGTLPTASYADETVSGGFFAINNATVSGINVIASADLGVTAYAFGMLAGVNTGALSGVSATMSGIAMTGGVFGALVGVNSASVGGATVQLSGEYDFSAGTIFAGGAFGENSGAVSNVTVTFANSSSLNASDSTVAAVGGVIGKQNRASVSSTGTSGGSVALRVNQGTGYVGGIVGIINTGAATAVVAGETLEPSSLGGVYAGAYTMSLEGGGAYKGLIAGCVGDIRSGGITGAAAHYYERGESYGIVGIPWYATDASEVSMYGYGGTASAAEAKGVVFRISDYSDDGAANFISSRSLVATSGNAIFTFPMSAFAGVRGNSVNIQVTWNSYTGDEMTSAVINGGDRSAAGDYSYTVSGSYLNGTGDRVPTIDFFATYSVDIDSGTEADWQNDSGIYQSKLYSFIDGAGANQLYAGALAGYIVEDLLIDKPMNGFVTMRSEKTLEGQGHTLMLSWVGSYDGNYVLQQNDRTVDNATSGSGGYVQAVNGDDVKGAVGGLIAVNYGTVKDLNVVHRNGSTETGTYAFAVVADAYVGVLVGANYGTVKGISYNNSTASVATRFVGRNSADVVYGGIVGVNAATGTAEDLSVQKYSAVTITGAYNALYGGVVGQNFGTASGITLANYSQNMVEQVENGVYGGAVGSNGGTLSDVSVTVGTETLQSDYLSRLSSSPAQRTITFTANTMAVWGGVVGYNAGSVTGATLLAHTNYGLSAGSGHLAAGGMIGMNDGGSLEGLNATGWGGFYVYSSMISETSTRSVFVGGLVGAMNADGASQIGFVSFANTAKATIADSVFALSGGIVTMNNNAEGKSRYGYVSGVLAAVYGNIPENAVSNTFWFISDKLQSVEGDDAEILPAFHGGNESHPTYISAFGMVPTGWLGDGATNNKAEFATGSYGFTFVDSDDNPINYLTMDASINAGVLTLTVYKPSGAMFIQTPDFNGNVTGSGGTGSGSVGAGGSQSQILTVSNVGLNGIGYLTFSFESEVYALTGTYSEFTQYMILSFLSTRPFGTVTGSGSGEYYTYSTVDGRVSRSIGDSFYRVYQVWAGATEMQIQGSNQTIEINAVPSQALILNEGKRFNGGASNGVRISVSSSFENNIALYTFGGDLDGTRQTYVVVSEFLAINYGTFTNANVSITGTDGGHDITRSATQVLNSAFGAGLEVDEANLTGLIYGMLVGVNEGEVSYLGGYSFDRTIELDSDSSSSYNSIFGGMVGAQSGADALISNIGDITFGTADRAGGITMSGSANLVSAGGVVGIAIDGVIENFSVKLTANSFLTVTATHNTAVVGGVVGDLRGTLRDVTFESEYQSKMMISGTKATGVAALANLVGIINSFEFAAAPASIEKVKVIGVGYLYNGLDANGTVTTQSTNLYTAGVVAMGANYGNVDAESVQAMPDGDLKTRTQQLVAAYGEIRPALLDSVYVDFEGYVRAKANTNVGMIAARILDGVTTAKDADGNEVTVSNVNTDYLKNLVWQNSCEGDSNWATSENYADYTETFGSNENVAILGYAPVTIDSTSPDLRGSGMRIWLTNNLYATRSTVADMVITWTATGVLNVAIDSSMSWQSLTLSTVYYDESESELSNRFKQINDYGNLGSLSQTSLSVNVTDALAAIANSAATFPHGIYMLKVAYKEVYIYNQKELIAFFSLPTSYDNLDGSGGNQYYSEVDGLIGAWTGEHGTKEEYRNAEIGILANDITISYGLVRVTMSPQKILEGNGKTVTFDFSADGVLSSDGTLATKRLTTDTDDKNYSLLMPAGVTGAASEYDANYIYGSRNASFARYIGGTNVLSEYNINTINTLSKVGIRVGGLFVGRNLGTIQNVNFVVPQSVKMSNQNYGTFTLTGIVCAVNAGTIDNCSVTIEEDVKVGTYRYTNSNKDNANEVDTNSVSSPWINTAAVSGGIAGLQYGTADRPSYISNSTVTLSEGSEFRAESQVSSFYWLNRLDNIYAYAGGVVGWLTSDSTIYNITVNGSGTMTAWGELNMGGSGSGFSNGRKVTSAGAIVGLNSDHQNYSMSQNDGEYGLIDGVICNWNGAAYYLTTSGDNIYQSGRMNYYMGAQLVGIAEQNTLNNIYFMYGIDNYQTFHQDNWYYGDNADARKASEAFAEKYDYIVSRAVQLLESDTFPYSAVYAIAQKSGSSAGVTEVAYRNADGSVTVNLEDKVIDGTTVPAFTFENYANYQDAVDASAVSGATNFSLYVAEGTTFYVANQYFPRITSTMDSGGDKNLDFVGARAAAMITSNNTTDWNWTFKPNNVYLNEVGFGVDETNGTEIDVNDPDTTAYLSFQTTSITSDVEVNVSLKTDNMGAQFVWKTIEVWFFADGGSTLSELTYYDNVTSLEQAKANNSFVKIFDRENDGTDFMFTYVMGMAIRVAMDENRYYYDDTAGVFYDSVAKIYDGTTIEDPMLYYADEDGNRIESLGEVSASLMSPSYYRDSADGSSTVKLGGKNQTVQAGAYRIRISFTSEGGENSKVNTTNRTMMFSDFDHIDIYTVVLPKGVAQNGVAVSKTYDGTTEYGASTTVFSGMISGDSVALSDGVYSTFNAGSGNIFKATFSTFVFSYAVMTADGLEIKEVAISLFAGDYDTPNYAPVTTVQTGNIVLTDGATDFYNTPSGNYQGTIRKKQIWLTDVDLDMFGRTFTEGGVNPPIEYDALTTYDTEAFAEGSTILQTELSLSSDKSELTMKGYRASENVRFTITFLPAGSTIYESSVKNYGTYRVYLNIIDSQNFTLYENSAETTRMYIGQLSITEYEIQSADVTYVISSGYLSKIFDGNGTIPFTFNPSNLRIIAKNGYKVQPDEYTLTTGAMYTTSKNGNAKVTAKDAGEYDIYFEISNFNCPLGNYVLNDMTVSFVDTNGNKISYFVLPKEIRLASATKEFDGSANADASATTFTYDSGYAPISGSGDVFGLQYASVDAGANINVTFTGASTLTLNGTRYNVVSVVEGANKGTDNYFVSNVTAAKGNITPVQVTLVSATMTYNNRNYIDYRAEGTEVVINNASGERVNIYPSATFNNKNAGTNKTVTFATDSETIAGKRYNKLVNSAYVSSALPGTGAGFAGNYYVQSTVWNNVGEIVKNTLSLSDIAGNVTIIHTNGNSTVSGSDLAFENLSGQSYIYRYGYYVGFEINPSAILLEDDLLSDHLTVAVTNTTNTTNGYVGAYRLELQITGSDYDWDIDVSTGDRVVTDFRVERQTLGVGNVSATLPSYEYTYVSNTTRTNLTPTVTVTDLNNRVITSSDGLTYSLSAFTNTNYYFSTNRYSNNSVLDVGDYYFTVAPVFAGADNINYYYSGSGYRIDFCVYPYTVTSIRATKEFDNTNAFDTEGNEAVFEFRAGDPFTPAGTYSSATAGSGKGLNLDYVQTTINGTTYRLLRDVGGRVTNNTWNTATGTIERYTISSSELNAYIMGWVKDSTERQLLSVSSGSPQLEYRSDTAAGYSADHFLFDATGMSYGFTASRNASSLRIVQNGSVVETLSLSIVLSGAGTFTFRQGDTSLQVLPAGTYNGVVSIVSSQNFALETGAGRIGFTVNKQEINGGGATGSANVVITLGGEFSYMYGESGFNLPEASDAKFVYTMNIIDKYTGKIAATYTQADAVIGTLEYTLAADATDYLTSLDGPLYIGGYYVWASDIAEEIIVNYSIPEGSRIAVYTAGTAVPEVPDEGEDGGESGTGEGTVTIPSLAAEPAYFILPRTLNIESVAKTYDGTDSFNGAVLTSDALAADALTAETLGGIYASPNANYDSTGTTYIDGNKGSDYLLINVTAVTVNGVAYYTLATGGVAGNYCLTGEFNGTVMSVTGAKIMRKAVDGSAVTLTSDTFETVYGSDSPAELPEVTADFGGATEIVVYAEENVVYKQGGEVVDMPANVGGYEMYLTGIAFDNYEVSGGISEVLVNAGRNSAGEGEEGAGGETGGAESGGETGGTDSGEEGGEEEAQPETYTYYIVPQTVVISSVVRFYDKGTELGYLAEGEDGVSAQVTVTDAEGNVITDEAGDPVVLRVQGRFVDAGAGKNKDVLADFTPFGYYVNFETSTVNMYYRLIVVGEDGTGNVASNYCLATSDSVLLPGQFDEGYVPEDPDNDDTPVVNNNIIYNMTLAGAGTMIPAPLTVEGISKVYDGTYAITAGTVTGMLAGDEALTVAKWRYEDKNAGIGKAVGIETDGEVYEYDGVTYYAVYMTSGDEKILSDYGVAATGFVSIAETTVNEDGQEVEETVIYAVVAGAGEITPYALTTADFSGVNVAGIAANRIEYNSSRTYTVGEVRAMLSALGFSAWAANVNGTLTFTFDNGDELTFTATLGGGTTAHDAGTYTVSLTLTSAGNYTMAAPYTVDFVIVKQHISAVYVITGDLWKEYDGTGTLPAYTTDGWTVYAVDRQGALIDPSAFEGADLSAAQIVFRRYVEEEAAYEYFSPVNAYTDPGYEIYVNGITLDSTNYTFASTDDAAGCVSFDQDTLTAQRAHYVIRPFVITLADGAFDSKKFDGAFSLRIEGVNGETVIVGDSGGVNASLAGIYGNLSINPYISGVAVSDEALNQESAAGNYALYYDGSEVGADTVLQITGYTVTSADVLVAEREHTTYRIGISGLQGLDFLFAKTTDISDEARGRIEEKLMTGETWTGGSFDSASDFALLNKAVADVFALYVNNGAGAVVPSTDVAYAFDSFGYKAQGDGYVLTFTFAGISGYDNDTATDRYTFVITGASDDVKSTNYSTTSSELESGQLTVPAAGAGVAVSTSEELVDAIKNNKTFYLANSIYGADLSSVADATFTGTMDGRGYVLSISGGASVNAASGAAGLLVAVNNGTIRNLSVKLISDNTIGAAKAGGLVGVNNGTIENVSVELVGDVTYTGATYAGGIAGENTVSGVIDNVSFVYSADVTASGATFGGIAGNNAGTLQEVAVRVNESAGAGNYTVSAGPAGYIAGVSTGTASGVIVAIQTGRLVGASALWAGGTTTATGVYAYFAVDGAEGEDLSLLEPYPEGYIGYYFATADDYTTDGAAHNELTSAGEYNKSYYVDYTNGGAGYVAIEAIAAYNRFIWDGYGVSYRTAFGDGNVGSSLNRIVALFAAGGIAAQFDGTTVVTSGVDAFNVATGVRGGTVDVEGDVETSVKEVVYTGEVQVYKVNMTVTTGGVSETKELSVAGTDAGYYSKASLEGIIGGGAGGETIGNVTYDSGSRTEYTFSGGGATVASGIALVIYPEQINADDVSASKYYDTTSAGTLTLTDGDKTAGTLVGNYYDEAGATTSQVASAVKFGFASFGALTRSVLSKSGVLYGITEKTDDEGVVTYDIQPISVGSGDDAVQFTVNTTVGSASVRDLMIAYSRLVDEDRANELLGAEQLSGYTFVKVYDFTADVSAGAGNVATVGGNIVFRPVLSGDNGGNYSLYSAEWVVSPDTTVGADESGFTMDENAMTVAGAIIPIDLGVTAQYAIGRDQSYNSAMLDPEIVADKTVTVTQEQAAALGISAENYARLVAEVGAGITVTAGAGFYDALVSEGVLEKRADGKYYTTAAYSQYGNAQLPDTADGGNFVVTVTDNTVTFRYFATTLRDGKAFYTLTGENDYYKWIDNETGTADYYAIDMLLTVDVNFGGKVTDMLAWRDAEGNVVGYQGTFDGDGHAFSEMIIDRAGSAALFERVDEGGVVRNLTVADTVIISTGAGSVAGGIVVDNYGRIENCAFEGVLSANAATGGIAATNYGEITGGVSVNRAYVDDGGVAEGIAADGDDGNNVGTTEGISVTESVEGSGESAVVNTVIENADESAADWSDSAFTPVISAYVFDERYVKVDGNGKFVTDNFFKLNAVSKLFGWVGKGAVTNSSQTGFYGTVSLS